MIVFFNVIAVGLFSAAIYFAIIGDTLNAILLVLMGNIMFTRKKQNLTTKKETKWVPQAKRKN